MLLKKTHYRNMVTISKQTPALGVATVIKNSGKIVLGRRLSSPMPAYWQLPGSWVRVGESPEQAANRNIQQFCGIQYTKPHFVTYTDNQFPGGEHSISLYFELECLNADTVNLQMNKDCDDWYWADWYDLPNHLFHPLQILLQSGYEPVWSKK